MTITACFFIYLCTVNYTFADIASFFPKADLQIKQSEASVRFLLIDSRQITSAQDSIFIALPGEQFDGHQYLIAAYRAGVRSFILSDKKYKKELPKANLIFVENTRKALQELAAQHRQRFSIPVIGITGSNGKTIVKEWLFQLLRSDFSVVRSPKSYNSQIGVPLSVWEMQEQHDLALIEAGISLPGEMVRLEKIIRPRIGILTNIGAAHDEGFTSRAQKKAEKMLLFRSAEIVICSYKNVPKGEPKDKFLTWGRTDEADLQINRTLKTEKGTKIFAWYQGEKVRTQIPFQDTASLENALHCWLTLLHLNLDRTEIEERMSVLEPVAMRLELKQGASGSLLINDSYNSDLTSLKIALRFLTRHSQNLKRTLILSDILQSGKANADLYQTVALLLKKYAVQFVVGIGEEVYRLGEFLPQEVQWDYYEDTTEFLVQADFEDFGDSAILLKGARRFAFEKIAAQLEQKTHNTVLEVNLNALLHNLKVYRSYLSPETKLLVMVKASAYGSGSLETAKVLEYQKVDYFGVAYADEGVELRKNGIKTPILVLNPEAATFAQLVKHELEPEIYNLKQLKELVRFLALRNKQIGIHLKLETGMNRLGFEEEDLTELGTILQDNPSIKVLSIFSHLAGSEAGAHDDFTTKQAARFRNNYEAVCRFLTYRPFRHILNSSGIARFPEHQMEMVRLGIGIYGTEGNPVLAEKLRVVNTLKARISQIKNLEEGDTVGYGRQGIIKQKTRSATISVGYADGLLRAAGNGKFSVLLHGKRAPIIGNICMDMCMVNVTNIPEAKEGDEVIIFGENPRVEELAQVLGTIPYEVFTNTSERVKRIYIEE